MGGRGTPRYERRTRQEVPGGTFSGQRVISMTVDSTSTEYGVS